MPDSEKKNNLKFASKPRADKPNTKHGHSDKIRQTTESETTKANADKRI